MASQMSTREDLLALLNRIKQDACRDLGKDAEDFYPFTMQHLLRYCNPNHVSHRYRQFKILKKSGGFRQITAPYHQGFMMLLRSVNEILKAMYTPSAYAMGFAESRSVVTNAAVHRGQNYVFNIDLKDFFPSVEQPRVWKRLQLPPFNFPQPIANVLAGLCSMRETRTSPDGKEYFAYVLPQGAPISPIITNMVCDTLDRRLAGLAKRFGLHYTRYADDITFSSMHYVYAKHGDFRHELIRIITSQGFTINEAKTRLQKLGSRQEVTGIIVSNKLNVIREYVREIRSLLFIWERYGYSAALLRFLPTYKAAKGHVKKGNPDLINVLDGKLMYLKMVKGSTDAVYLRLYGKFQELVAQDAGSDKRNEYGVSYTDTKPLIRFEQAQKTKVVFYHRENGSRSGLFEIEGIRQAVSIHKHVTPDDELHKEKLAISLCRSAKGSLFWLVHLANKKTVFRTGPSEFDELNKTLDALLGE